MPFSDSISNQAFDHCIKDVCKNFDLEIRRSDEIFSTNPVYDDIIKEINEATIIIVDISGKNPNVFYELGIAHTIKPKYTIIITHDEYKGTPFDVAHFRIFKYENSIEGTKKLENNLTKVLKSLLANDKTIYKDKLEFTIDIFQSTGKHADLYAFLGLKDYPSILHSNDEIYAEGHNDKNQSTTANRSAQECYKSFIKLGYVKIENDILTLTSLGIALAQILKEKGFVCDLFNGISYTPNYVSFMQRISFQGKEISKTTSNK